MTPRRPRFLLAFPAVTLAAALVLTACGEDNDAIAGSSATSGVQGEARGNDPSGAGAAATAQSEQPPPQEEPLPSPIPRTTGGPTVPKVAKAKDLKQKPVAAAAGPSAQRPEQLIIEDLVVGSGKEADLSDTVNVQYVGTLFRDGKQFDASWDRGGEPVSFPLGGVVPGFAHGIVGMKEGGRRVIVMPSALGYGEQGQGPIPPDSDLVFVVDLVKVES